MWVCSSVWMWQIYYILCGKLHREKMDIEIKWLCHCCYFCCRCHCCVIVRVFHSSSSSCFFSGFSPVELENDNVKENKDKKAFCMNTTTTASLSPSFSRHLSIWCVRSCAQQRKMILLGSILFIVTKDFFPRYFVHYIYFDEFFRVCVCVCVCVHKIQIRYAVTNSLLCFGNADGYF